MSAEKTPNYTAEQTAELVQAYKEAPNEETVKAFAAQFGKSVRSIVAKLSREGVYQKKEYVSKSGEAPMAKEELASKIGELCDMSPAEMDSLAKANKTALVKLLQKLS